MTESFILEHIPERVKQMGYRSYRIRYRDLMIKTVSTISISAFNELWFIVDDPAGLLVESHYGIYDTTGDYLAESIHQHRGDIVITNPGTEDKRIKFIQVVIVN